MSDSSAANSNGDQPMQGHTWTEDGLISIIKRETSCIRDQTDENSRRLERVEQRLNNQYIRITNVCSKILPSNSDWVAGIRNLFVSLGLVSEADSVNQVLSLDLSSSRPKNKVFVVQVHEQLRKKVLSPTPDTRKKLEQYCLGLGKEKSEILRFYPNLTKGEELLRDKSKYFMGLLIRYNQSVGRNSYLIKTPHSGQLDRIILENKDKEKEWKRKYVSYEEIAEMVGTPLESLLKGYEVERSKRAESLRRVPKRPNSDKRGPEAKKVR